MQEGRFGACLMAEPDLVARCVEAMRNAVPHLPVTVKCRIGIDKQSPEEILPRFISIVHGAGCDVFIVHARMAWLEGLSPKQNRELPPLNYPLVHRMKSLFPHLTIVLNGGVTTLDMALGHLEHLDGVMLGRAAYQNPYILADVDRRLFGDTAPLPSRAAVIERLLPWADEQIAQGVPLQKITRHLVGLFQGQPGARAWRRHLSEHAHLPGATAKVIRDALARVIDPDLARRAA